jgi:hypothetical protein
MTISRDMRVKYDSDAKQREDLIGAAGYFAAMLHRSGMTVDMKTFAPAEQERAVAYANQLLQSGKA